eukprot:SAG31_NODE_807_length_11929_cov_4.015638_2_plen_54_part_00
MGGGAGGGGGGELRIEPTVTAFVRGTASMTDDDDGSYLAGMTDDDGSPVRRAG